MMNDSVNQSLDGGKKKKYKIYKQRYLDKWEQDWRFEGWLTQCKEDPDYAYCRVCHTRILARVASLIAHYNASKHKKKMKMAGIDWLSDDNQPKLDKKIIKFDIDKNSSNEFDVEYADLEFYEATSHEYETEQQEFITADNVGELDGKYSPPKRSHNKKNSLEYKQNFKFDFDTSLQDTDVINSRESSLTFSAKDDEFSVYGKHVANELRQVSDDFAQQAAKMKINTILFEARTGHYASSQSTTENVTTSTTTTPSQQQGSYQFVVCPN